MDATGRAAELLRTTEQTLRGLVADAAAAGDYGGVVQIAQWAKAVNEICLTSSVLQTPHEKKALTQKRPRPKSPNTGYPRFYRLEDVVIRVALSKREGEYQHKASFAVIVALADVMATSGADGRVFSTDEFLPLRVEDTDVPQYQAYLGIALFKQTGLIDQHGRQGYSIPRLAEFKDNVTAICKKLPRFPE